DLALRRFLRPQAFESPFGDRVVRRPQVLQEMVEIAEVPPDCRTGEPEFDLLALGCSLVGASLAFGSQFRRRQSTKAGAATVERHDMVKVLAKRGDVLLGDLAGVG